MENWRLRTLRKRLCCGVGFSFFSWIFLIFDLARKIGVKFIQAKTQASTPPLIEWCLELKANLGNATKILELENESKPGKHTDDDIEFFSKVEITFKILKD